MPRLSDEQQAVFHATMSAVTAPAANPRGNGFYVDGPGGSGKTFLYEALIHTVRGKGMISLACAISGIAAQLLPGGTTAHSLFGLPIDMPKHDAMSSIRAQEPRAEVLRRAVLILWDEVSMVPLAALDCVDRLLRDLTGDSRPFGGKVLVLGGDFRQLLPVLPGASEPELVANTVLHHYSLREGYMARFSLTTNMRLLHGSGGEDTSHRDWLLQLGSGLLPGCSTLHQHAIELPEHLCVPSDAPVEEFIQWIFPELRSHVQLSLTASDPDQHDAWFRARAILTSRNNVALHINNLILDQLDAATEHIALSLDSIADTESGDTTNFPVEFLNTLTPSGLPPHRLRLRVGAVVIVLRNLDKERGILGRTDGAGRAADRFVVCAGFACRVCCGLCLTAFRVSETFAAPRIALRTVFCCRWQRLRTTSSRVGAERVPLLSHLPLPRAAHFDPSWFCVP